MNMFDDVSLSTDPAVFNQRLRCVPGDYKTPIFGTNVSDLCHDYLDLQCARSGLCSSAARAAAQPGEFFVIVVHYSKARCRRRLVAQMLQRHGLHTRLAWTRGFDAEDLTLGMMRRCLVEQPFE